MNNLKDEHSLTKLEIFQLEAMKAMIVNGNKHLDDIPKYAKKIAEKMLEGY